jgi:2,3-bisphosphoglycerate-independent phosphoglycerate mutase
VLFRSAYHPGISYRHCMIWSNGPDGFRLTPPHDILEKRIKQYLPQGENASVLYKMMKESYAILKNHPVNRAREAGGLRPANSIWLWGEGRRPAIPLFAEKYGVRGSVVSAVDLIKGIGICAGLTSVEVEGATGNIHTNFYGKARAALDELEAGMDFVYVHVEAPDECGHRHEIENKVKSIELIDRQVVGTILEGLEKYEDYGILVLPDHPTPLPLRTHTSEPVPYLLYRKSGRMPSGVEGYDEFQAAATGIYLDQGHKLMDRFLLGK